MKIKLISTDMDETLLIEKTKRPENFAEVHNKLKHLDIKFVIASGRSYSALKSMFLDVHDDLIYIAENGALVVYKEQELYSSFIDSNMVKAFIKDVESNEDACVSICTKDMIYIQNEKLAKTYDEYNYAYKLIPNLIDYIDNLKVIKFTIYDYKNSTENSLPLYKKYSNDFNVTVSGTCWLDITNKGINKGQAINLLQEKFNINKDNCMAFGDYLNDLEMLQAVKYSYAMANAHDDIKKIAYAITEKDHKNNGVLDTIEKLILSTEN